MVYKLDITDLYVKLSLFSPWLSMKVTILTVGTRGDVQPCIALGQAIQESGHTVSIAAPVDYQPLLENSPLEFFPIHRKFRDIYNRGSNKFYLKQKITPLHFLFSRRKRVQPIIDDIVNDLVQACTGSDVILYTALAMPAHTIAEHLGIASIALCLQPLSRTTTFPSVFINPSINFGFLNYASHFLVEKALYLFFRASIQKWRNKSVTPEKPSSYYSKNYHHREYPVLNGFSSHLVSKPADWGDRKHITGFWFLREHSSKQKPSAKLRKFLENGEPPVCIDFGSMNDCRVEQRILTALEALRQLGKRVVLIQSSGVTKNHGNLDNKEVFVTSEVSHSWLFSRVCAVISHGGAGTIAAALQAGVVSIVVPFFFDQQFWGNTLASLGVGPQPIDEKKFSVTSIKKAINDAVAKRKFEEKLLNLSEKIGEENGLKNAVRAFEYEASCLLNQKPEIRETHARRKIRKFT